MLEGVDLRVLPHLQLEEVPGADRAAVEAGAGRPSPVLLYSINQKPLLAINNLKHSTILNSIVTIHNINTIY